MKWLSKDVDMYLGAKEYVDTVIMPVTGVAFDLGVKQSASANEFITLVAHEIEKQFKGRLLLLPPFTYYAKWDMEQKKNLMLQWKEMLLKENFSFVFFLTADADWKAIEQDLENSLLYLPSLPLEHLEEKYKISMMEEQVSNILTTISQRWRDL